jgi:aspartyl-tRNA(Asn)/glutamyl-tRNA(Gln) amidotransferase subunit A
VTKPSPTSSEQSAIWITEVQGSDPGLTPLAVKDLFDTAGIRTTYGSILFDDHVPARSAEAVVRLEAAGYATIGKANLHEFAYGTTSENAHYGAVPNPVAPGRTSGGSSGGSAAALAAGLAEAALGTDSGGSIRIPSACCGTVGLKTTWGLVPLDGCFPLAPTFDTAGPMARDVAGCARMMAALVPGFTPEALPALADLAVGVAWLEQADPLVRERVAAVAARFPGARPIDLPLDAESSPLFQREVADVHAGLFAENSEAYGPDVARKIELCLQVTDRAADAAGRARELLREQSLELIEGLDLVLTPTLPCVAPPSASAEDDERRRRLIRFTYTVNALGWPALALPCGAAEDGLPASVQLIARPGDDARLLAVGAAVEAALA